MATDILEGLNPNQREAVETIDGPLLIIAGPGSGKTRVITHRIAYLVRVCGVSPYQIAAVTFTNKAARVMRERLNILLGPGTSDLTANTFHAFCAMVLRREGHNIGLERNFTIYDNADQISLLKRCFNEVNVDPKKSSLRAVQSAISSAKSQLIGVEGFGLKRESYFDEIVHRVYERYDQLLSQSSAVDFDDLLLKVYNLLQQHPAVAEKYQDRYVHLMIDEFQDTNVAQYAIARQLTQKHRNICAVGDPDQSIYSWRNADIRNILSFKHDYSDAKVIALEENYRSTGTILDASKGLIAPNEQRVEKDMWTGNDRGVPIVVSEGYDEGEEALFVVREVERLVREEGYTRTDMAVMYRVNAQSRALEEACLRYGVPYQLVGSLRFYQRQEIKDLTAYLRLVANLDDDVSLARVANVPPRGIGQRTLDELTRLARDQGISMYAAIEAISQSKDNAPEPPAPLPSRSARALMAFQDLIKGLATESKAVSLTELIDLVLERSGYRRYIQQEAERGEERWENIQEFRDTARDFLDLEGRDSLTAFLESVSLVSDSDNLDEKADAITLITLHQAKGLEFPVVFIVGMEEGLLPHARSIDDPGELEEERRLCYVGFTRAKERLFLNRAFRRRFRGGGGPSIPSRFLTDIPQSLVVSPRRSAPKTAGPVGWTPGPAKRPSDSKPALATGDKVLHATFGEGIVTSTKPSGIDVEVTVAFIEGQGVKRLLLSFAPLEKVG